MIGLPVYVGSKWHHHTFSYGSLHHLCLNNVKYSDITDPDHRLVSTPRLLFPKRNLRLNTDHFSSVLKKMAHIWFGLVLGTSCSLVCSHHPVLVGNENHKQLFQRGGSLCSNKVTEFPNIFFTVEQEQIKEPQSEQELEILKGHQTLVHICLISINNHSIVHC